MTAKNGQFTFQNGADLKDHFDEIIILLKELVEEKISNILTVIERDRDVAEEARNLFKETNDAHLNLLNGETTRVKLRELDFAKKEETFITRIEVNTKLDGVNKELKSFAQFREERGSVPADIATLKTELKVLTTWKDTQAGRASADDILRVQKSAERAYVIGIVGTLLALVGILLRLFGL
jgi:hypothetical protein